MVVSKQAIIDQVRRTGYEVWVNVCYEGMAVRVAERLNAENPKADASIGFIGEDETFIVWYRPN